MSVFNASSVMTSDRYLTLYALKDHLINRLSTGNQIYDTVLSLAVISSQDTIVNALAKLRDIVYHLLKKLAVYLQQLLYYSWMKKQTLSLKRAKIKYITDDKEINPIFECVNWYIHNHTDVKSQPEILLSGMKNSGQVVQQIPRENKSRFMFCDSEIEYVIYPKMVTIYGDREYQRENMIIDLSVNVTDANHDIFKHFVETCQKQHQEFINKRAWVQQIFRNGEKGWISKPSDTSRKISTVILKENQMQDIVDDLNDFLQKEEWYVSRDVPYARRYLFYGTPGTGKSSCIRALASHAKRHIHYLVLSEVKSDAELFKLFETVNFSTTILVIEDIDCASKIVMARESNEGDDKKEQKDQKDQKEQKEQKSGSTLTLSGLLNAIDGGMIQTHGQILIMTTNHPDQLDPALIRAGRVDRNIEFSNCTVSQIRELFRNFFDTHPEDEITVTWEISPAEVTSVFLRHKKNPKQAWDALKTLFSHEKGRISPMYMSKKQLRFPEQQKNNVGTAIACAWMGEEFDAEMDMALKNTQSTRVN